MNTHHTVNYVEFTADDFDAVKAFYTGVFGWTFTDFGTEYTAFNDSAMDGGFAKDTPQKGGSLVVIYSENLEASQEAVEAHGGVVTVPIFSFPGGRRFHFKDPAGNELAIWSDV